MTRRVVRRAVLGCAVVALAVVGTACTSSHRPLVSAGSDVSVGSAVSNSAPATDTTAPTSTAATTTTAASSSAPRTSTAGPGLPKDTCTTAQLTVRMIRGGADTGREIGLVTFTNISKIECSMFGFPGVSLRLAGAQLAAPAGRDTATVPATVHLAPGDSAQAQFTDFSSCQSPLSDNVRIYPPNLTSFVDRPGQFRGCKVVVEPVTHS